MASVEGAIDGAPKASLLLMSLAALGIVFGDIGTSPLYTFKTILNPDWLEARHERHSRLSVAGSVDAVYHYNIEIRFRSPCGSTMTARAGT